MKRNFSQLSLLLLTLVSDGVLLGPVWQDHIEILNSTGAFQTEWNVLYSPVIHHQ